jgi:hypothetical protein
VLSVDITLFARTYEVAFEKAWKIDQSGDVVHVVVFVVVLGAQLGGEPVALSVEDGRGFVMVEV